MASGLKFLYYTQKKPARRTVSSSASEYRLEEFKRRFRRSGSLGVPFFPEEEVREFKNELTIQEAEEDESGSHVITVIVCSSKSAHNLSAMLQAVPRGSHVKHLESRDPKSGGPVDQIEVLMEVQLDSQHRPSDLLESIQRSGFEAQELTRTVNPRGAVEVSDPGSTDALSGSPWFPKSIYDLDICSKRVIMYGDGLDADHPGFKDVEYRKRRMLFADIAINYKQGQPIPRIDYTESEKKTWKTIYLKLRELHKKHACQEFLDNFELLERHCGYSADNVPQSGPYPEMPALWRSFAQNRLPCSPCGWIPERSRFPGRACFSSIQLHSILRHHADPFYTPEPDTVHELMGHMALFADPDFAQFSQEIGLASLGASEEDLQKLATLYFFSIEFGLCTSQEPRRYSTAGPLVNGQKASLAKPKYKIYGAGLLSSAGELQHAVSDDCPEILRFDPDRVVQQECLITTFQTAYFYTRNFEEAQQKLRMFVLIDAEYDAVLIVGDTAHVKGDDSKEYNDQTLGDLMNRLKQTSVKGSGAIGRDEFDYATAHWKMLNKQGDHKCKVNLYGFGNIKALLKDPGDVDGVDLVILYGGEATNAQRDFEREPVNKKAENVTKYLKEAYKESYGFAFYAQKDGNKWKAYLLKPKNFKKDKKDENKIKATDFDHIQIKQKFVAKGIGAAHATQLLDANESVKEKQSLSIDEVKGILGDVFRKSFEHRVDQFREYFERQSDQRRKDGRDDLTAEQCICSTPYFKGYIMLSNNVVIPIDNLP